MVKSNRNPPKSKDESQNQKNSAKNSKSKQIEKKSTEKSKKSKPTRTIVVPQPVFGSELDISTQRKVLAQYVSVEIKSQYVINEI